MQLLSELKTYARFASGLRSFLKHPIPLFEATEIVDKRKEAAEIAKNLTL